MPACLNQHHRRPWFAPRPQVARKPIPDHLTIGGAFRFFAALDGVIDEDQIAALARDAGANADGAVGAALGGLPLLYAAPFVVEGNAPLGDAPRLAAKTVGEQL